MKALTFVNQAAIASGLGEGGLPQALLSGAHNGCMQKTAISEGFTDILIVMILWT